MEGQPRTAERHDRLKDALTLDLIDPLRLIPDSSHRMICRHATFAGAVLSFSIFLEPAKAGQGYALLPDVMGGDAVGSGAIVRQARAETCLSPVSDLPHLPTRRPACRQNR